MSKPSALTQWPLAADLALGAGPVVFTILALLLSLGRVPEDALFAQLRERGNLTVRAAGDCLSPRGLEEAILEGTLAARRSKISKYL